MTRVDRRCGVHRPESLSYTYTLVANHIPVNARIIGAHDHESHYVFDLLFNNTTEIQPAVHSTDTHGTNQQHPSVLITGNRFYNVRFGEHAEHYPCVLCPQNRQAVTHGG